ncbi:MAG: cation:proton antiporter [Rhodocyclaceae bacterium]|nr:cation:proton antiporter [Rhodocyclaceae bacterium]
MYDLILPSWPPVFDPSVRVGIALLFAALAGEIVARLIRLPRITGYSIAGLVLGPAVLGWFGAADVKSYRLLIDLALALLLFEMGVRVDLKWFRANPVLLATSLLEAGLTFACTYVVMRLTGASTGVSAGVAVIAMSTSPAIVMRMALETRAEGQVTQRMFVLTALNVVYAVVAWQLMVGGMHGVFRGDWFIAVLHPAYMLIGSLVGGVALALAFTLLRRAFNFNDEQGVAVLFGLLLSATALLIALKLPALLAPLIAGMVIKNTDPRPHLWPRHFGTAGGVVVILLFVFTGLTITPREFALGGTVAILLIFVRSAAKTVGVLALGHWSGLSVRQAVALGIALSPMSGVALLLASDVRTIYPEFGERLAAIVLCMAAILELASPIAVQWVLRFCRETREK